MKLNIAWGILALGDPISEFEYGRRFAPDAYKGGCRDIILRLIPVNSADNMLRALHIEELLKLVRRSSLKSRFYALDSFNTYDKSTLAFPSPGLSSGTEVDLNPKVTGDLPTSRLRISGQVSGGNLITYHTYSDNIRLNVSEASYPIVFNNGQSDDIPVAENSLYIRFRSPMPSDFEVGFEYIDSISVSWEDIMTSVLAASYTFTDPDLKSIWGSEANWLERLAALTVDVLEACSG